MLYHYNGELNCGKTGYYSLGELVEMGTLTCYENGGPGGPFSWRYKGQFKKGYLTGEGRTTYGEQWSDPDLAGWVYIGAHVNGDYHGQGTSHRPDGNIREDGAREDGTKQYEGQWKDNCWCGPGTLYLPDGSASPNGNWVNGYSGEYEWEKGEEMFWYEGDWDEEGCPHGWGILYRPDRTTVEREGWWQNGEVSKVHPPGYPV